MGRTAVLIIVFSSLLAGEARAADGAVAHRDLPFASVDGVAPNLLSLDLYVPEGATSAPLLVMIHGGGWRTGDKANAGMTEAKVPHFTKAGWAYASINYRLSPDVKHPVHVQDVAKAVAWLHDHVAEYGGDPERIFLMGHSAGAHLAALVATDHRRLEAEGKTLAILDGVVLLDGAGYDLGRLSDVRGSAGLGRLYEGAFTSDPVVWRDASPMTHVAPDKGIPPFLVFHAGRRPASEILSQALVKKLRGVGVPARAVPAPDRNHGGMNRCIGVKDDPYTRTIMSFLSDPKAAKPAAPTGRPNVVWIVADDLGYADVGFQGCTDIPTPHIDKIATGGVRFTDGYVSCPVCSPTRAGLLTGRYQQRFGYEFNPGGNRRDASGIGLPTDERTVADLLKAAGYATGMVGKWHLGQEAEYQPTSRGFESFYGFLGGARSYFDGFGRAGSPMMRGGETVSEDLYLTDAFAREAVAFIEEHHDRPFFLYLPFNAVHTPMDVTPKYYDRFPDIQDEKRRTYAGMTSAMDDAVGAVLDALRTHGLEENTLVVFLSDNGGPPRVNASSNAPLRAGKGTVYEGGVRVPFAMRWPGRIPADSTYENPVISLDLLATSLAAVGAESPSDPVSDGVDLLPFVQGKRTGVPHETLYWRQGARHAVRRGDWKLVVERGGTPELYRLDEDVGEATDLAQAKPEILAELQRLYDAWDAELVEPRWGQPWRERPRRRARR